MLISLMSVSRARFARIMPCAFGCTFKNQTHGHTHRERKREKARERERKGEREKQRERERERKRKRESEREWKRKREQVVTRLWFLSFTLELFGKFKAELPQCNEIT